MIHMNEKNNGKLAKGLGVLGLIAATIIFYQSPSTLAKILSLVVLFTISKKTLRSNPVVETTQK